MTKLPCKECLVLPMCKTRQRIVCHKLYKYVWDPTERTISYMRFTEAQLTLLQMNCVSPGEI